MVETSVGVRTRKPGDCGDAPLNAVYYDGLTAINPIIQAGHIVFQGGKSFSKSRGIGINGPSSAPGNNWFKIPLKDIQDGGSGVKIRGCVPSLKKRVRFKCCAPGPCSEFQERTAIEIKSISSCENPRWYTWNPMKEVFFECGCTESCCQKLNKLKAQFDADVDSPVNAYVTNVGDTWYIDLESKVAGDDFLVKSSEGLTPGDVIVPNFQQNFTARTMVDWFPDANIASLAPTACMDAIEIFYWDKVLVRGTAGTTNPMTDNSRYETILNKAVIIFNPAVANSVTAKNATITILSGTSERDKKVLSTTAVDFPVFPYCIVRTDDGSEAALTAVRTDYPNAVVSLGRSTYKNGQSYYSLSSTSGNTPAPVTPAGGSADIVNKGFCGRDDMPCNVPDGCPEVESSICLNC